MEEAWSFPQMAPWQLSYMKEGDETVPNPHKNYISSDQDLNQTKKLGKFGLAGTKQATKMMNKFGLAGNCFEWDQWVHLVSL